jgi:hypothetical protein
MAVVLENSQLVWKKVKNALANATPASQEAFQGLRKYLSTQVGNPDLQFIAYSEAQAIASAGTDLVGAACKVYGWYGKASRTTGTTSAFLALHAAATSNATTTTIATNRIKATGQTFSNIYPRGLAAETGLTIDSATAVGGATESTTPDGADGFVVIGAA